MICPNCQNETDNPKFCSRSCAAIFNNKLFPKRIKRNQFFCQNCSSPVSRKETKMCKSCFKSRDENMLLRDAIYTDQGTWNAYNRVRQKARQVAKLLGWKACVKCGYDKHIEIAHQRAISSFDEATPLSEINSPQNLLALCPNCHWEFDNTKSSG